MGKPTGFLEYDRKTPLNRPAKERLEDWHEFYTPFAPDDLNKQCARCMDCGIPFCHTGSAINGKALGCPLGNLIPEWNELVYRGEVERAYERLCLTNNFPEFTGRVCPAPCEGSCTLGSLKDPVAIHHIEAYIANEMFEQNKVRPRIPALKTGEKIAVVGSGPSGLAAADCLNQMGHCVTVYEREDLAGGLLMYGIPNMKLDKAVVQRRVELLTNEGVTFKLNTEIGSDKNAQTLLNEYDAVILCCGASKPRALSVKGNDLTGVYYAVDFLKNSTRNLLKKADSSAGEPVVKDKQVVVIGGGDTGTDCIATAIRLGAAGVCQIEIMPEPPQKRRADNPWPYYPAVKKTDYGQEEALYVFGQDPRLYSTTVKEIHEKDGKVGAVTLISVTWEKDEAGRQVFKEVPGTEKKIPADIVLIAMGFTGPESTVAEQLNLETDSRNFFVAAEGFETALKGVFTAGDMRRGQSLVVWAIHEGREAAKACDHYLKNRSFICKK